MWIFVEITMGAIPAVSEPVRSRPWRAGVGGRRQHLLRSRHVRCGGIMSILRATRRRPAGTSPCRRVALGTRPWGHQDEEVPALSGNAQRWTRFSPTSGDLPRGTRC
jgi:hypothetical protein